MPFPRMVLAAVEEVGYEAEGILTVDRECEGAKFHSPHPLMVSEVPLCEGAGAPVVLLCGTCADNLSILRHLLVRNNGRLPWPVRREFGNTIRALALQGWDHYAEHHG